MNFTKEQQKIANSILAELKAEGHWSPKPEALLETLKMGKWVFKPDLKCSEVLSILIDRGIISVTKNCTLKLAK